MKIIKGGRQNGKTTALIRLCAENGGYIVCRTKEVAKMIKRQAEEMGLNIPLPLTHEEFRKGSYYGRGIGKVYIDDTEALLNRLAHGVTIEAFTICDPEGTEEEKAAINQLETAKKHLSEIYSLEGLRDMAIMEALIILLKYIIRKEGI